MIGRKENCSHTVNLLGLNFDELGITKKGEHVVKVQNFELIAEAYLLVSIYVSMKVLEFILVQRISQKTLRKEVKNKILNLFLQSA